MSLGPLPRIEVYIDRPNALLLRARVVTWPSETAEEPHYGPNLLPGSCSSLPTAKRLVEKQIGSRAKELIIHVDPRLEPLRSLNDKAVSTPRDRYGFRSSGR